MNEYDVINTYLHLLNNNTTLFIQRVFFSMDHFFMMKTWLQDQGISLAFMEMVNDTNFTSCKKAKNLEKLENVLYQDFKSDISKLQEKEKANYHVLFLHGPDNLKLLNEKFVNHDFVERFKKENIHIYHIREPLGEDDFSFYAPHPYFLKALYQIDNWPGILVFKEQQWAFYPVDTIAQVDEVFNKLELEIIFNQKQEDNEDSYFIQLSDLHLGTKNRTKGRLVLEEILADTCPDLLSKYPLKFLITGDLMNSPNRKNMYEASSFMNMLKRLYKSDVTFILGNHDVIVHGLNIIQRQQKAKVVAYLLGENIKVLEKEKIIIVKINSTVEGNLARGKVGQVQMNEIDEELRGIENIEEYTLIAMLHHHVFEIPRDEFLRAKWHEKIFVGKFIENTKVLVDAKEVIDWLKKNHIEYVFHGHKHLPFYRYQDGLQVISGGSSCGGGANESKSRYLSYNVLKYNHISRKMKYCFIFYNDMTKEERQRVKVHLL